MEFYYVGAIRVKNGKKTFCINANNMQKRKERGYKMSKEYYKKVYDKERKKYEKPV
jgi:hypothetical protein